VEDERKDGSGQRLMIRMPTGTSQIQGALSGMWIVDVDVDVDVIGIE
jgi:hypothetical protein